MYNSNVDNSLTILTLTRDLFKNRHTGLKTRNREVRWHHHDRVGTDMRDGNPEELPNWNFARVAPLLSKSELIATTSSFPAKILIVLTMDTSAYKRGMKEGEPQAIEL